MTSPCSPSAIVHVRSHRCTFVNPLTLDVSTGLGRRFAITEGVSFLANLLRRWRVEPILKSGETLQQWRSRVLTAEVEMLLGVGEVSVRLVARTL